MSIEKWQNQASFLVRKKERQIILPKQKNGMKHANKREGVERVERLERLERLEQVERIERVKRVWMGNSWRNLPDGYLLVRSCDYLDCQISASYNGQKK